MAARVTFHCLAAWDVFFTFTRFCLAFLFFRLFSFSFKRIRHDARTVKKSGLTGKSRGNHGYAGEEERKSTGV